VTIHKLTGIFKLLHKWSTKTRPEISLPSVSLCLHAVFHHP